MLWCRIKIQDIDSSLRGYDGDRDVRDEERLRAKDIDHSPQAQMNA